MKTIPPLGSLLRRCTASFLLPFCIAADVLAAVTIQPTPSVVPGAEVVLSTSASLSPPVTYQWRKGGNPITGATNATYAIASAKPEDSGSYDVVITSTNGSVTDTAAALVVLSPPAITTHPAHAMVQPGGTVTLSVVAAGSAPLANQWHRNNTPIAGATAASLVLNNVQLAQAGRYHVAVSNAAGSALSAQAEVALTGQLWALGSDTNGAFGLGGLVDGRTEYVRAASNVVRIEAGGEGFGFFIRSDKSLWASGANYSGQLGDGTTIPRSIPFKVADRVVAVAASKNSNARGHALFIDEDGALWGMGENRFGNLGDGSTVDRLSPVRVLTGAKAVRAGGHSLVLKSDGTLWGTGQNSWGQLGLGTSSQVSSWRQIATGVVDFDAGGGHSLYVTSDGVLFAMGYNAQGQLGDGTTTNRSSPVQIATGVASVSAGILHSLFVKVDGSLWSMGYNWDGQLGDGARVDRSTPQQVATGIVRAQSAGDESFYLKSDFTLWSMKTTHVKVASEVTQFSGGRAHYRYLSQSGEMWVSGSDRNGQLGLGRAFTWPSPVRMAEDIGQASILLYSSQLTKRDGTYWLAGQPRYWHAPALIPTQLSSGVSRAFSGASFPESFTVLLKENGAVYTMGYNSSGVLGAGTNSVVTTPLQIGSGAVDVAAGRSHGFFIKADGSLWGLGLNSSGQLGDGTTNNASVPVRIAEGVASVSAGSATTIFLKHDGSAWAMGSNSRGQFGVGTTANAISPIAVGGGFAAVSAGEDHALFLRADGVLLAAGANDYGQLGDGSTTARTTAVQVASGVAAISASPSQSAFLKLDGTLWAMGSNDAGQLGDGTRANRSTPVQVASNVVGIARVDGSLLGFIQAAAGSESPVITTPPSAGARALGDSVLLSVAASGPGPIDYQWRKNGVAILGARGPQLFLAFAQVADSGTYDVVASNRSGSVTSAVAALTVGVVPTIATQPLTQTVAAGSTAALSVATSGSEPFTYQWRKAGANLAGATNASFNIAAAQGADAGAYDVIVSNAVGSATSTAATLTVTGATSGVFALTTNGTSATITGYTGTGGQVVIPATLSGAAVTAIGENAFSGKTAVTGVEIPASVTAIGPQAFGGCTGLTAITIPAGVTSIGQGAFDACTGLTSVSIPASVTSIGSVAFRNTVALTTITVDAGNTAYFSDGKALYNKAKTRLIQAAVAGISGVFTVPAGVTIVDQYAFYGCTGLTGISIPSGVTSIGGSAFRGCSALAGVTFPATLTNIAGGAFYNCPSLEQVVFLGNAPTLDAAAFNSSLKSVYYLAGTTGWGTTFGGATTYVMTAPLITAQPVSQTVTGGNSVSFSVTAAGAPPQLTYQWRKGGANIAGATTATYTITAAQASDAGSYDLVVTNLGGTATSAAATLTVTGATPEGFAYTSSDGQQVTLTGYSGSGGAAVIPATIGGAAVTAIGKDAFSGKTSLSSVSIPAGVTTIGSGAFSYCSGLGSISVDAVNPAFKAAPGGLALLDKAGTNLIYAVNALSGSYVVPSGVVQISPGAFTACNGMTAITFPASLTTIGAYAFANCHGLTTVAIPAGVVTIGEAPFYACDKLAAINVDAANPAYASSPDGRVLFNKAFTQLIQATRAISGSYVIPDTVTSIAGNAFGWCSNLTRVVIPASVTTIGHNAFQETGLVRVVIPAGVTALGARVFSGSSALAEVAFVGNMPAAGSEVFRATQVTKVYYASGASGWEATFAGLPTAALSAPVITFHPAHAMVPPGGVLTLSVTASSAATPEYQWYRNNVLVAGATAASLALTSVQLAQAGRYHVAVSNAAGTALSAQAEVALTGQLWALGNDSGSFGIGAITGRADYVPAASNVTAVESGGQGFGYFIRSDKTLWGSGTNGSGQLGDGTTVPRSTPIKVADGVVSVAASKQPNEFGHTLFIDTAGAVWGIGGNNAGNLGDGTTTARTTPVKVFTGATAVRAGLGHSLLLKVDGTLWGTGQNTEGQLGLGSTSNSTTWKQIAADVVDFDAGGTHSLYVTSAGVLFAMGGNSKGQLGDGANANRNVPVQIATGVASVAAGLSHSLFVKTDGSLWAMGSNWEGQLGDGSHVDSNVPKQVATGVLRAHGASDYSFFLKSDGTLWSLNTTHDLVASGVVQFSGGRGHHRYVNRAGEMWVNGSDFSGQLGLGRVLAWLSPVRMATEAGQAAIFYSFSLTTQSDGSQWLTGQPRYWNVSGSMFSQLTTGVARTAAGQVFAIYLKSDGSVYTRGYNSSGVLGAGTNSVVTTPLKIASDAVDVAAGRSHGFFIKTDGSLWGLGLNSSGQLGDGSTTNRSAPVRVAEGVASVSAGVATTILLKHDGSAWAMGDNSRGQFGVGTTTSATSPLAIGGGFAAVSVGEDHALFLRKDGVLLAAGANGYGQLGDGTTTSRTTAVEVASGVVAISAAPLQSFFLKLDGTLWAMGRNDSGQLGDGTRTNRSTPVQVAANVVGIARVDGSVSGFIQAVGGSALPLVTTPPSAGARVPGESVLLSVNASGPGPIDYQWRKDGVAILGARGPQLFLAFAQVADSGSYDVVVSNRSGSVTSASAVLSVGVAPQVSTQPLSQTSPAPGGSVVFSVAISGTPAPALQWYFNGAPISGATGATLTLSNVQASAAGVYWVVATNSMGSVRSSPASFSLTQPGNTATQALVGSGYVAGQTLTVTNTLTYTGTASALSWSVLLPAGWSYASSGGSSGEQGPAVGMTNVLDWAWTSVPPSPVTFTYTLNVPAGSSGPQELVALGGVRNGTSLQFLAQPDPLPVPQVTPHTADTDQNFRLSLLELTRVIELYNTRNGTTRTGCYAVATTTTEDGFAPDSARASTAVVTLTRYHSADSNRDGKISLLELTRVIELYNYRTGTTRTGDYHVHPGSEDGFNPGPASAHPTL